MRYITLRGQEVPLHDSDPNMGPEWLARLMWGPQVTLWRKYRDGTETREQLPELLARWTLRAIPQCEPNVARARIERE